MMKTQPTETDAPIAQTYRPDIDGLRAIAVGSVLIYHFFPSALPGGLVGVDIFFVISGYLINRILMSHDTITTSVLRSFYARRIRRIFPALLLVMWCTFAFGWIALYADEFKELGKHMLAGAGFASNWVYLAEAGYFDADAGQKPLLHLWSLAVEEQFYLIWPLLLMVVKGHTQRKRMIVVLWTGSFIGNLYVSYFYPEWAYYLSLTRFWEILTGAWLACHAVDQGSVEKVTPAHRLKGIPGFILLLACTALVNGYAAFPGWQALIPVLATAYVIWQGNSLINRRVLGSPPMVWIGLISYPLYLWHWPIIAYLKITEMEPSAPLRAAGVITSLLLATLTYLCIEKPIRHRKKWVTVLLVLLMVLMGAIGHNIWRRNGLDFRQVNYELYKQRALEEAAAYLPESLQAMVSGSVPDSQVRHSSSTDKVDGYFVREKPFPDKARFLAMNPDYTGHLQTLSRRMQTDPVFYRQLVTDFDAINRKGFACSGSDCPVRLGSPRIVVLGDSHAENLHVALRLSHPEFQFLPFTRPGCTPISTRYKSADNRCRQLIDQADAYLMEHGADLVLLAGRWPLHFGPLSHDIARYRRMGLTVALAGPSLDYKHDVAKILQRLQSGDDVHDQLQRFMDMGQIRLNEEMKNLAEKLSVPYIDKIGVLCGDGLCKLTADGTQLYITDYGHLSLAGSMFMGSALAEQGVIRGALRREDRDQ